MIQTVYDIVIIIFLFVWLIATVLAQFKIPLVLNYDYLGLLPSFRFFAPRPVTRDIRIYVQATDVTGNKSTWRELFFAERKWWNFIWNPYHKLRKTTIDLYSDLDDFRESKNVWHLSFPYLIILNASNSLFTNPHDYKFIQFMFTCYAGHEEATNDVIFLSNLHAIEHNIE